MAGVRKTMRDVKTLSGRVDRISNPYMAYMQVTCLEMEKVRKGQERASALQRLEILDARIGEIDTEKAVILRSLSEREKVRPAGPTGSKGPSRTTSARGGSTLRLRY